MIVIADSGSTTTDWLLLTKDGTSNQISSKGLNPAIQPAAIIDHTIKTTFNEKAVNQQVCKVYYFGAGCWNEATCLIVEQILASVFPNAMIAVQSDVVGAIKATCGHQAGITCILGTGSNSCLFDGTQIVDAIPTLGYIIGDEGSGSAMGKQLLRHYFYRELPNDLHQLFWETYQLEKQTVIEKVYRQKGGNRYLASFTLFLSAHKEHPFIIKLVKDNLKEFLIRHVLKYKQSTILPIHFVGSIAYHFNDILLSCLQEKGLQKGKILQQPIKALGHYYRAVNG